jgi:hypothetical protein
MFNLLVKFGGWADTHDTIPRDRVFEATSDNLLERFSPNGAIDFQAVAQLPCLFLAESDRREAPQIARIGAIHRATIQGGRVVLNYAFDTHFPQITNAHLETIGTQLHIPDRFHFRHTHWAIKDVDLFKIILRNLPQRTRPQVFRIADPEAINPRLVSAMMPFAAPFDAAYATLQQVAEEFDLTCRRADDIWINPEIIQDVVHLIDTSRVVICDCTDRNPNVFYEAGIAHTLGREVIFITQNRGDIPFDLQHLRYIRYLNNDQGRAELANQLRKKLRNLL